MRKQICTSDETSRIPHGCSHLVKLVPALFFLVALTACDSDGNYQEPVANSHSIKTPSRIKPRALTDECNNSLEATLSVGEKSTSLSRSGDNWSGTLSGLTAGPATAIIEFSCLSGGTRLILASAEKQVTISEGGTDLAYADNDFGTDFDNDLDGSSNLEEIEVGADPLSNMSIAAPEGIDSFENAMEIQPGVAVKSLGKSRSTNTFVSGDNTPDYYKISVSEHADYHVRVSDFGDADMDLYLYQETDSGNTEDELISRSNYPSSIIAFDEIEYDFTTPDVATYYIKAENFASAESNYTIRFDKVTDTGGISNPFFTPQRISSREPASNQIKSLSYSIGRVDTDEDRIDVHAYTPQVTGDFELELRFGYGCCTSGSSNVDLHVYEVIDGNIGDPIASGQTSQTDEDTGRDIILFTVPMQAGSYYLFEIRGVNTKGVAEQYLLFVSSI